MPSRFINYATVVLSKLCGMHKRIFAEAADTEGGMRSLIAISHSSISEPVPLLTQISFDELKHALHNVQVLCLGMGSDNTDVYHAQAQGTMLERSDHTSQTHTFNG